MCSKVAQGVQSKARQQNGVEGEGRFGNQRLHKNIRDPNRFVLAKLDEYRMQKDTKNNGLRFFSILCYPRYDIILLQSSERMLKVKSLRTEKSLKNT